MRSWTEIISFVVRRKSPIARRSHAEAPFRLTAKPGSLLPDPIRARSVRMPKRNAPSRGRVPEGVVRRHRRHCAASSGGACDCGPSYQAQVWSVAERKTIRKTFPTLGEARAWRAEAQSALRRGTMQAPTRTTLAEAAAEWLAAAQAGIVRTRSGERYKPSALRAYEQALRTRHFRDSGTCGCLRLRDLQSRISSTGSWPKALHPRPSETLSCR